jgi:RNA polymerase I-specific transcription initiation factor RRN7
MAIYTLLLPINLGDIFTWVQNGELLYYHAIREIPSDMLSRLPSTYHSSLDPSVLLTEAKLWHTTTHLIRQYQRDFGIAFPPLNWRLHLYRSMTDLALPLPVYQAAKRLGSLLGWDFTYPSPTADTGREQERKRTRIVDFPEAQLVAVLVVAVKLLYPFDGVARFPERADEPAAVVLDWDVWSKVTGDYEKTVARQRQKRSGRSMSYEEAMKVSEDDVLGMSEDMLDAYLEWYGSAWTDKDDTVTERGRDKEFRRYLLNTFPVDDLSERVGQQEMQSEEEADEEDLAREKAKMRRVKKVMESMVPRNAVPDNDEGDGQGQLMRPGMGYRRYRSKNELTGYAKDFYGAAAKFIGFDLDMLIRAVFLTEVKLEKWMVEEKKKESIREGKGKEKEKGAGQSDRAASKRRRELWRELAIPA